MNTRAAAAVGIWSEVFFDGGDNIDKNPMFIEDIDPTLAPTIMGDPHLQKNSPTIDMGNNDFISGVDYDLDGYPRIIDGNKDGTPTVDMGAFEYQLEYPHKNYISIIFR